MIKLKIRRGDSVIVITGKDKGKIGKVLRVLPSLNRAVVSGVNIVKKHTKPTQHSQGGIIQKESTINISNIAIVDPKTAGATKIGFKFLGDGTKVRQAKKSGEFILKEGK